MGQYRINRNITASVIQYIEDQLVADGWSGITVLKGLARAYDTEPPIITVRCSDSDHNHVEIGDNSTTRETIVFIDIFGADSGMGLVEDLKDWLIEILRNGCTYYQYTITAGAISEKISAGKITFLTLNDSPVDLNLDRATMHKIDRWRWLITARAETGLIET